MKSNKAILYGTTLFIGFLSLPLKAAVIYTSPVTGEVGFAGSYSSGNYYHQIFQNTGQNQYLEQFALHTNVGGSSSTHNLTGTYGLDIYASSGGARGSLLGSFTPTSISSQFTSGSSSYRTFTFNLLSSAILIPHQSSIFLLFKPSTDTVPIYTHASGIGASSGFSVGGETSEQRHILQCGFDVGYSFCFFGSRTLRAFAAGGGAGRISDSAAKAGVKLKLLSSLNQKSV